MKQKLPSQPMSANGLGLRTVIGIGIGEILSVAPNDMASGVA